MGFPEVAIISMLNADLEVLSSSRAEVPYRKIPIELVDHARSLARARQLARSDRSAPVMGLVVILTSDHQP